MHPYAMCIEWLWRGLVVSQPKLQPNLRPCFQVKKWMYYTQVILNSLLTFISVSNFWFMFNWRILYNWTRHTMCTLSACKGHQQTTFHEWLTGYNTANEAKVVVCCALSPAPLPKLLGLVNYLLCLKWFSQRPWTCSWWGERALCAWSITGLQCSGRTI